MWWPHLIMLVTFETECCHLKLPTLHSCTFAKADLPRLITKFISTVKLDIWEESWNTEEEALLLPPQWFIVRDLETDNT